MIVDASIRNSYIWQEVKTIHLRTNMHVRAYINQLHSPNEPISKVYPQQNLDNSLGNPQIFFKSAILTTQNSVVDALNEKVLNLMPGDTTTLLSSDSVETSEQENDEIQQISTEYLHTLNPANFPPAKLILKKGCIIMLLRNLGPEKGLCNGTRLIVKDILAYTLIVAVMHDNGSINEQIEIIPRIQLFTLEYEYPFILTRKQFPVKLIFAMTINKSQGHSLSNVGIDFRSPAFTHGQIYVALSRSINLKGIHILHQSKSDSNPEDKAIYTTNKLVDQCNAEIISIMYTEKFVSESFDIVVGQSGYAADRKALLDYASDINLPYHKTGSLVKELQLQIEARYT
ncbi:hypothetical protein INT48_002847 [Thamnidium elegans]|uniref:ATP-dependent DNA helicase n=1 Tax=Thamnidium elegans TaxID=101142 RepID=A0A8H7SS42_9FUNG|nr:hypothetical protein INT48_002847 [Thamnidium elegans]